MSPTVTLDEIREALSARVEEVGWRGAARQVGLSPNGLRGILEGKNPYTKSLRALHAWYRAEKTRQPPLPKQARRTALIMLTRHLPDDRRQATIEELERVLEAAERRPSGVTRHRRRPGGRSAERAHESDHGLHPTH